MGDLDVYVVFLKFLGLEFLPFHASNTSIFIKTKPALKVLDFIVSHIETDQGQI